MGDQRRRRELENCLLHHLPLAFLLLLSATAMTSVTNADDRGGRHHWGRNLREKLHTDYVHHDAGEATMTIRA